MKGIILSRIFFLGGLYTAVQKTQQRKIWCSPTYLNVNCFEGVIAIADVEEFKELKTKAQFIVY